jgi:hypothetical protein
VKIRARDGLAVPGALVLPVSSRPKLRVSAAESREPFRDIDDATGRGKVRRKFLHQALHRLHGMVPGSRSLRSLGRDDNIEAPLLSPVLETPSFDSIEEFGPFPVNSL